MKMPPTQIHYFPFIGGVDKTTPPLALKPGVCSDARNFEAMSAGGYKRIDGYVAYDSGTDFADAGESPLSDMYYIRCEFVNGIPSVGTLTNFISTTSKLIAVYLVGDGYVVGKPASTFVDGLTYYEGGVTTNAGFRLDYTNIGRPVRGLGLTPAQRAENHRSIFDANSAYLAAPAGSGAVRGGFILGGKSYAFRDDATPTYGVLHRAESNTWNAISQYASAINHVRYTVCTQTVAGTRAVKEPAAGDTISGGGVSATIYGVYNRAGTCPLGTGEGTILLGAISGIGYFNTTSLTVTGADGFTATLTNYTVGVNSTTHNVTLPVGGRWDAIVHDFGTEERAYMVHSSNALFEMIISGSNYIFVPIFTSTAYQAGTHIAVYKNHLFVANGNSVQHSSIGNPYAWSVVTGAGELNHGESITGMKLLPGNETGGALAILSKNRTTILYGDSSADWTASVSTGLTSLFETSGAREWTTQTIGKTTFYLDDTGIRTLDSSASYGNFDFANISDAVRDMLRERVNLAACSMAVRSKNQYRIFFTDNTALYFTVMRDGSVAVMPVALGFTPNCAWTGEDSSGNELLMMGATDGYVYRMDRGKSFHGSAISGFIELAFNNIGSPRTRKRFRKAALEITGGGYSNYKVFAKIDYGSSAQMQPEGVEFDAIETGGVWDSSTWDAFTWDGQLIVPEEIELTGTGANISLRIQTNSDMDDAAAFHGAMIHYTPRRNMR